MRLRNSASGDSSPFTRENIDVAVPVAEKLPSEPPRKRIKLKFTRPSAREVQPVPLLTRPKRQSAGRVHSVPETVKSDTRPKSTKRDKRPIRLSSSPVSLTPNEPTNQDESTGQGYGVDFLMNFIEDSTPSSTTDAESLPDTEKRTDIASPESVDEPITVSSGGVVTIGEIASPCKRQRLDHPEIIIKKLQAACHGLEQLNISAGPMSSNLPPFPPRQGSA